MKTALQIVQNQLTACGCSYGIQVSYTLGTLPGAPLVHVLRVFGPKYLGERYEAGRLMVIDWREDFNVAWLLEPRDVLSIGCQAVERANGPRQAHEARLIEEEKARQLDIDLPDRPF